MIRPTPAQIAAAHGQTVPDIIAPDLAVVFCGINPSLYSAAVGHHFARPGNRFWKALHAAGFTPRVFSPEQDRQLLALGLGLTNIADKATATADQVPPADLRAGGAALVRKIARFRPRWVAFLGLGAYRTAFGRPRATLGPQPEPLGSARLWVLPNPSGLNAHYQVADLGRIYGEFRAKIGEISTRRHGATE